MKKLFERVINFITKDGSLGEILSWIWAIILVLLVMGVIWWLDYHVVLPEEQPQPPAIFR